MIEKVLFMDQELKTGAFIYFTHTCYKYLI